MTCSTRPPKESFRILFFMVIIFNLLLVSLKDQVLLKLLWRPQLFSVFNVSYPQGKRKTRVVKAKSFMPPRPSESPHTSTISSKSSHNSINILSRNTRLINCECDTVWRINFLRLVPPPPKCSFSEVGVFWDLSFVGSDRK
jgi:hypothetical protein